MHPVVGGSWEGFVIETLAGCAPDGTELHFYRTSAGAEVDLVLSLPGGARWVVEIKRSLTPKPERGFHHACEDLEPDGAFVVYSGSETYPLGAGVEAIPLRGLGERLLARR